MNPRRQVLYKKIGRSLLTSKFSQQPFYSHRSLGGLIKVPLRSASRKHNTEHKEVPTFAFSRLLCASAICYVSKFGYNEDYPANCRQDIHSLAQRTN